MFISLLLLLLPFMGMARMSSSTCIKHHEWQLLDCSKQELNRIPFKKAMPWVRFAIFKNNNFTRVNITKLLTLFPNVEHIDFRHNPIQCITTSTSLIIILSDCPFNTTQTTTVHNQKYFSVSTIPVGISTSAPNTNVDGKSSPLVLPIVLPVCIVFVCLVVFRVLLKRRLRPSQSIAMENLNSTREGSSISVSLSGSESELYI